MTYVTPASITCLLRAFSTVEVEPTRQKPSSKACSNAVGKLVAQANHGCATGT